MVIKKILFVHNAPTSFVSIDHGILKENYEVEELHLQNKFQINPSKIWKAVRRNDLVFTWFASWHSLLPVLFSSLMDKPSLLVSGGYDTANIPAAGYGNQRSWWKKPITNFIIKRSTHIICNSNFAKSEILKIIPHSSDKITMIYHGIPEKQSPGIPKSNIALNVGNVFEENLLRKGIEPFLAAGRLLTTYHFIQTGPWKDRSFIKLIKYTSSNVEMKGFSTDVELQILYSKSRVYVQPSLHEGFGLSVAEAMQEGCIPIVSPFGALPEMVGEYGIVMEDTSPESIIKGIQQAENFHYTPLEIRQFTIRKYSLDQRKTGLFQCIKRISQRL
jgi:glycosyltransferase involved in cell wall biosynthesis